MNLWRRKCGWRMWDTKLLIFKIELMRTVTCQHSQSESRNTRHFHSNACDIHQPLAAMAYGNHTRQAAVDFRFAIVFIFAGKRPKQICVARRRRHEKSITEWIDCGNPKFHFGRHRQHIRHAGCVGICHWRVHSIFFSSFAWNNNSITWMIRATYVTRHPYDIWGIPSRQDSRYLVVLYFIGFHRNR